MNQWLYILNHWIGTAPDKHFWITAGIALVLGLSGWYLGFRRLHHARLIEDVPTSKVRSAAQGYVELIGLAKTMEGPAIVAPLTGSPCVWYRYRIEEHRRSRNRSSWNTVEKGISDHLFLLEDQTGNCIVDPDGAKVTVSITDCWYGNQSRPEKGPSKKSSWLQRLFAGGRYRYSEWRLEEYDPLYAIGWFKTVGQGNELQPLDSDIRELVLKWKHEPQQLARFDSNRDGEIDLDEWNALREAARQEIIRERLQQPVPPSVHLIRKPQDTRPFMLSTLDPEKMARQLRWSGWLILLLAIIASSLIVYAINLRLA